MAQTYLKGFCNPEGKVCVYFKDNPTDFRWTAPEAIAFEKYYYSQPLPDGGRDNNRLEDFFATIEDRWPLLMSKIERRERNDGGLDQLLQFALMHRVRVPTARDAIEKMLAESVRMTTRYLNDRGELQAPPDGSSFDYLDRHTVVSIDPHKSIHAMTDLAKGMMRVVRATGFKILGNQTDESFITSDNPVIYFDPAISPKLIQPYNINRSRMDIEFMFPLTPRFMLWGHSIIKPRPGHHHTATYEIVHDKRFVQRANVLAARFANRMIFSNDARYQALVKKYAATSPVVSVTHLRTATGRGIFAQHVFGKRQSKPKWKEREEEKTVYS